MEPELISPTTDDTDARAAHFEREENFRWLSSLLASTSPQPLTERVPTSTQQSIYSLAEFAEISHGSLDPAWMLVEENRRHLGNPSFPLEQYPTLTGAVDGALEDIQIIERFHGTRGGLQGYCALRMSPRTPSTELSEPDPASPPALPRPQVILAFSGTSNARLALYDVMVAPLAYKTAFDHSSKYYWRVHDGFQRVYRGVRHPAFKALRHAITSMEAKVGREWDLVLTAHSLGAAVSYLTLLDILHTGIGPDGLEPEIPLLPTTTRITIATFGSPRVGNPALVNHYRELIAEWREKRGSEHALTEWSIIGHMDGVPALPPTFFGYAHFSAHPFYSYGGHLYRVPADQSEYTNFKVETPDDEPMVFGRGGHNYYGARDMERLQRRMKAIFLDMAPDSQILALQNIPPRPRRRSHRSISEAGGFKNKRLLELSRRPKTRAVSLPGGGSVSQSSSTSEPRDDADDTEESSGFTVPPESATKHPWIQRYLEREKEEETVWARRNHPRTIWGTLKGVVSFGVFK